MMSIKFYVDIDKILQKRGLTLTQLADKTGISKGSLSKIRSEKAITFSTLNKLASGLNEPDLQSLISVEIQNDN